MRSCEFLSRVFRSQCEFIRRVAMLNSPVIAPPRSRAHSPLWNFIVSVQSSASHLRNNFIFSMLNSERIPISRKFLAFAPLRRPDDPFAWNGTAQRSERAIFARNVFIRPMRKERKREWGISFPLFCEILNCARGHQYLLLLGAKGKTFVAVDAISVRHCR